MARRSERRDPGMGEGLLLQVFEEGPVLWVGAWPAALNVIDAEAIEFMRDLDFVLQRVRNVLGLRAVTQGRIEDLDPRPVL